MSLQSRIKALAEKIRMPEEERRVILCWRNSDGLTKVADSHPHLPDDTAYISDMSCPVDGAREKVL